MTDLRVSSVDFFRTLPKTTVESAIGTTGTPNFYYAMSKVEITYVAPTKALRSRLPDGLDPLTVVPGTARVANNDGGIPVPVPS